MNDLSKITDRLKKARLKAQSIRRNINNTVSFKTEAKLQAQLREVMQKIELLEAHQKRLKKSAKTKSNPVLGIATPWWLIGGVVGFLYMRNSLRKAFGPFPVATGNEPHNPEVCPECQAKTHTESEIYIPPVDERLLNQYLKGSHWSELAWLKKGL